ncbi:MAG: hypothetical protein P4M07_12410 [Xanthobacteraceae bacterium]|nr:hypothetical protein [Xanthobacteraceae bacterium]
MDPAAARAWRLKIIRPNSSDPIAPPRPAPETGRIGTVIGRLAAILAIAALLLAVAWLRSLWPV